MLGSTVTPPTTAKLEEIYGDLIKECWSEGDSIEACACACEFDAQMEVFFTDEEEMMI